MGRKLPPRKPSAARRRVRDDVAEELEAHFEGTVELLRERGMGEAEAREEALRRFGDVARYRRKLERIGVRSDRRRRLRTGWAAAWTSLVSAVRSTVRAPAFATAAGLTLTLGIGANLAMFGIVDRLLLAPPTGIDAPDELRRVWVRRSDGGEVRESVYFSWEGFRDLEGRPGIAGAAAWSSGQRLTLGSGFEAERIRVHQVSGSYFPLLGARAEVGRLLGPRDDALDAPPVVVLSHAFWRRAFGADTTVLGRRLHLGEARYEVVGVTPPGFTGVDLSPVDAWLPLLPSGVAEDGEGWTRNRRWWWLQVVVRLGDPAGRAAAEAELTATHRGGYAEVRGYAADDAELFTAPLLSARGPNPDREAKVALWLAGVSGLVLLVACANVANLFLARGERRRRELALRMTLGVSRGRLLGELLAESLLLTLLGTAAALATLRWGATPLRRALLPEVVFTGSGIEARLFAFAGAVALAAAVLSGLLPAWRASRLEASGALGRGVSGPKRGSARARSALMVVQAALSAVLLVGAGLFVRSLHEARDFDLGFDAERVAVVRFQRGENPTESATELYARAEEALPRLPRVASAARVAAVPFATSFALSLEVPGLDSVPHHPESGYPRVDAVGADYFSTMGIRIVSGRGFEPADVGEAAEPVAIVTQALATHLWPREDPRGRCVRVGGPETPCARIVGVSEDVAWDDVGDPPALVVWLPQGNMSVRGTAALVVRLDGPPEEALEEVRRTVADLSPSIRHARLERLSDPLGRLLRSWRLGATVFTAFGALAGVVAGLGLYAMLAFDVGQRRRETGIRKALGAPYHALVSGVALRGVALVAGGLAAGLTAAWAAAGFVAPLLFQVSPRDPGVYLLAGGTLLAVAAAAALPMGHRAARADPREALRNP